MLTGRNLALAALAALTLALGAAGCGGGGAAGGSGSHPDYRRALAGSPPALAALHRQANRLLGGGLAAYEERLAGLRGYPAVVNVWASWCGPCRFEFPTLQRAAARFGKRVAFLGVDSQDSDQQAASFLEENPVPYPSYSDGDERIADSLGGGRGYPRTAFYDRGGELCYLKAGPYSDERQLSADIRRFALRGECEGA